MAQRKSDRQLRKTLAQLRKMRTEDRVAILDMLAPASRLRIERLLRGADADTRAPTAAFADAGYSPWLLARLEEAVASGATMTTTTAETLRECARERLDAGQTVAAPSAGAKRRPALFGIGSEAT